MLRQTKQPPSTRNTSRLTNPYDSLSGKCSTALSQPSIDFALKMKHVRSVFPATCMTSRTTASTQALTERMLQRRRKKLQATYDDNCAIYYRVTLQKPMVNTGRVPKRVNRTIRRKESIDLKEINQNIVRCAEELAFTPKRIIRYVF